ncbi:MAG: hypothetical protein AB2L24_21750 [Mangrovibacterium sp.]
MTKKTKTPVKAEFDFRTIKSFEDACKKENVGQSQLPDVSMVPEEFRAALINAYKLMIIFKAINNGWRPDWSNRTQDKYFPWFWVLSSGFGFSGSDYDYDAANAAVGSRLCTDTREKALYIAETFEAEYKEFFLYSE